ncbi:MAG: Sua5/YciO/YrdC/YwlC family protein [Armatimonadota bacterium]|nr:Sua5/YciO/YrdC/YwlC family protein [Armatimonadota bacterium]
MNYYHLTFEPGVDRQQEPVAILRVDADDTIPRRAVEVLRAGGLIVFPTEDGYLVGCNALDARAVRRLSDVTGATVEHLMRFAVTPEQEQWLSGPTRPLAHRIPIELMRAANLPLVATTVPPGGRPAPTAQHIVFALGDAVDLVLNAGRTRPQPVLAGR